MTLVEWIGFLISMLALIFLTMGPKRAPQPERNLTREQERARRMQDRHLRKMLGLPLETEEEQEEEEERVVRKAIPRRVESRVLPKPKASVPAAPTVRHKPVAKSRGQLLIKRQHSLKDAVVLREILGPPKGLL